MWYLWVNVDLYFQFENTSLQLEAVSSISCIPRYVTF